MNPSLMRHGFVLILLALVGGLFVSSTAIPRLALSAHTVGVLGGILLITLGAVWQHFALSTRQSRLMAASWLWSGYMNWLACLTGAVVGAGKMTPVASAGATTSQAAEALVSLMFVSVAAASFLAVGLCLWGLRSPGRA